MLKIAALYLCWTIFLVSGDGNGTVQLVAKAGAPAAAVETSKPADNLLRPAKGMVSAPPEPPVTSPSPPKTTSPTTTTVNPPKPDTTTSAPKTTTPVPDTTTAPPDTTTVQPNTTTSAPITTPAPPAPTTPLPPPKTGQWVVSNANMTCIVVKMAVEFNITYTTKDNKTEYKLLNLPTEANATNVTGVCGEKEQTLSITWHGGNDSLLLHFVKNATTKNYYMHHLQVNVTSDEFPGIKSNATLHLVHEKNQFTTGLTNSYRCMRLQTLNLTMENETGRVGTLKISEVQFQAFKTDKATNFSSAQDCSTDVPDVVPIAVGCVLTALVIAVLAAYLIGRRRSQARGYVSM